VTLAYEDALQQVLDALHAGDDVEGAFERFPDHAAALREDVRLSEAVTRLASAVPAPRAEARAHASRRMLAQLDGERAAAPKSRWSFGNIWLPRYALAAAVVAIAVLGAGLLLDGGGATVEAATIEGVVVDNQDGTLTVQTLEALERVQVPAGTRVSDVAGAPIGLRGIEVGQVVVIDLQRRGNDLVAKRIQRYVESIEAWCADASARCQALTQGLEQAKRACERSPGACVVAIERLEQLRLRAADSAALEQLKQRCRAGEDGACRQIVTFCREHTDMCGALPPADPPIADRPVIDNRLRGLLASCLSGDEAACRRLAQACNLYADLCPADEVPLPPEASPPVENRPNTSSPLSPTPSPEVRPGSAATPLSARPDVAPVTGDIRPTATPAR